jgi:hypothetical protein
MAYVLRLHILLWAGLCMLGGAAGLAHAAPAVEELDLKAAYIFNFIQFIDWPDAAQGTEGDWPVCVSPFSPLKRALTALDGKLARKGRPIRVKLAEPGDLRQCRVLVLHASDVEPMLRSLRLLPAAHGILTVADDVAATGGSTSPDIMITLSEQGGRIAFNINAEASARAGLAVSSRLLRLAQGAR